MTQYETAFLLSPNLEEEETEKIIGQIVDVVSKKKGKMINEDRWGKRKLAYPIKKFEEAFYVFLLYEGDSDIPFELERRFKQSETVLRYLTVKKEPKKSVRRKKVVSGKKEKEVPEEEMAPEGKIDETVTPDTESTEEMVPEGKIDETVTPDTESTEEKAPAKEKEAKKKIDIAEDDEPAAKKKAASKKEKTDKEEVDKEKAEEEKAPDEKEVLAGKDEGTLEDVSPPAEGKEEE